MSLISVRDRRRGFKFVSLGTGVLVIGCFDLIQVLVDRNRIGAIDDQRGATWPTTELPCICKITPILGCSAMPKLICPIFSSRNNWGLRGIEQPRTEAI